MVIDTLSVNGDKIIFFNPVPSMVYLRDGFFSFIHTFGVEFVVFLLIIWLGGFILMLFFQFRALVVSLGGGR